MLSGRALFQGQKGASDQLNKIWQLLGTPTKETWPEVVNYPEYSKGIREHIISLNSNRLDRFEIHAYECVIIYFP